MIVVGLTGSIGMGKSTAAQALRRLGIPVHDADATVHRLLAAGGAAVPEVLKAFPGVAGANGGVDRAALGRAVFGNTPSLRRLESILHPLVGRAERRFVAAHSRNRAPLVVLDIPLLYETAGERRCDAVLVVTAPAFLQRARVLARKGMTERRFEAILSQQLPDAEKRRRTPYVVQTGLGRRYSLNALRQSLKLIVDRAGRAECGKFSSIRKPRA